jgi:GH25 family lysozyme M1 (1,4-beta-N-acetylmuramidase)
MSGARHRRADGVYRVSKVRVVAVTCAAMAAVALGAYGLLASGSPQATPLHASGVAATASTSSLPAPRESEGHSPQLTQELSGPLTGTGAAQPHSAVRMNAAMQQATTASASTMLNGVDVSSVQDSTGKAINWASVAAAGNTFASIKATEGNYYVNPGYAGDAAAAVSAGLYVSAYAFANPPKSTGAAQADYVVQNAGNYKVGGQYLPLVLDIEYDPYATQNNTNECYGLSTSAMVSWISSFMTEATTLTGAAPIIYTPQPWWATCTGNSTAFGNDVLWVPAYSVGTPGTLPAGWNNWSMWQYTSAGAVNGISGAVDLDYFTGGPQLEQSALNAPVSLQMRTLNALAGQSVTYSAANLPPGVIMSTSGLITGTPSTIGQYQVTVTPAGASGVTVLPASISFTWDVYGTVTMASPGNRSTTAGSPVSLTLTATDSVSGYTPAFSATGLPPGLSISSGGQITGWPYTTGTYQVKVRAADSLGASATASFTWTVTQAGNSGGTGRVVLKNGGKCLDDTGSSTANGNKIQIWTCTGGAAQNWTLVQDGTLRAFGKCLDLTNGATANGTSVQLWSCIGGDVNQQWRVGTDGELVSAKSGTCLDDPYSRTANGTKLDIWSCNGGSQQRWTLPAAPAALEIPGKCLDNKSASTANGNVIDIWTCNGATSQKWTVESDGTLRVQGKCLDVIGRGTASGTKVQLWSCTAGDVAQQWQFAAGGELVNPNSGDCLADPADSTANGTQAEILTCPSAADPGTSWHMM